MDAVGTRYQVVKPKGSASVCKQRGCPAQWSVQWRKGNPRVGHRLSLTIDNAAVHGVACLQRDLLFDRFVGALQVDAADRNAVWRPEHHIVPTEGYGVEAVNAISEIHAMCEC